MRFGVSGPFFFGVGCGNWLEMRELARANSDCIEGRLCGGLEFVGWAKSGYARNWGFMRDN